MIPYHPALALLATTPVSALSASTAEAYPFLSATSILFGKRLAFVPPPYRRNILIPSVLLSMEQSRRDFFGNVAALSPAFFTSSSMPRKPALQDPTSKKTRICIVGGGIAGVTAAHSLAQRLDGQNVNIVVMEGNAPSASKTRNKSPEWTAATARNANSLVPGSSMHLMATTSTLFKVMKDTVREWIMVNVEGLQTSLDRIPLFFEEPPAQERTLNIDNFEQTPPYFALHLIRCLGWSASTEERTSFLRFLKHFVTVSLLATRAEERVACQVQLAKANRAVVTKVIHDSRIESNVGLSSGFLALHRSYSDAQATVKECNEYGEEAQLLSWGQATQLEPRLARFPVKPLYAVHRPKDKSASCEQYVRHLIKRCSALGVDYRQTGKVVDLEVLVKGGGDSQKNIFRITSPDGIQEDFDVLILAAGINTPLLAAKLGAGPACPTFPLRGWSLTLFCPEKTNGNDENLLNQPFSVDSMYCSSVSPTMARIAGFGELVGYREKAADVASVGPRVLTRYARTVFPDAAISEQDVLPCFRPISPDDLPLVGEVSRVPGLFLHTGHGTLGWTLSSATAECLAQAVQDRLESEESSSETFVLPDNSLVERHLLSPDRFV